MRRMLRPFLIVVALVFLFEAWLWQRPAPVVTWIVARVPLRAVKLVVAAWIEALPPFATLVVFCVPVLLLLPLKFLGRGCWRMSTGSVHWACWASPK